VKIAAITKSGTEMPIVPSTISFWWSRRAFSARSSAAARSSIRRSRDEGVDHRGLHLVAQLLAGGDRGVELLAYRVGHALIVRTDRGRGKGETTRVVSAA
jgi:hypothetical protein